MTSFRDILSTVDSSGKRRWVYPLVVRGRYWRARLAVSLVLVTLYLSLPWLSVGGRQAVLLDIPGRRFTFFGATFWATDTLYLVFILAGLGFALFFFSAVLGRVWCGWACPETVFLEFVFRPLEALLEGSAATRRQRDKGPWSLDIAWRKFLKFFLYALISWLLASTAVAYFVGRDALLAMIQGSPLDNWGPFAATVIIMVLLLFQFSWFREQFCTVLCPYARFQSVLLDRHSLLIGYDSQRGEPRGKLERGMQSKGDCIDCRLCVKVCPTGIDIRNGLQLECIQCAACADACDSVMAKIGRPKGLVRYSTEAGLAREAVKIVRPRIIFYGALLLLSFGILATLLSARNLTSFQVVRGSRDVPYILLADGRISNHMTIHIENKGGVLEHYHFSAATSPEVQILSPVYPFPVDARASREAPIFFSFPRPLLRNGKLAITLEVAGEASGYKKTQEITLLGPDE